MLVFPNWFWERIQIFFYFFKKIYLDKTPFCMCFIKTKRFNPTLNEFHNDMAKRQVKNQNEWYMDERND